MENDLQLHALISRLAFRSRRLPWQPWRGSWDGLKGLGKGSPHVECVLPFLRSDPLAHTIHRPPPHFCSRFSALASADRRPVRLPGLGKQERGKVSVGLGSRTEEIESY